jgi:amino acid transporter
VPIGDGVKRLVLGRALRNDRISRRELSKRTAIPMFASDALSSNAYATQEIWLVLSLGGFALLSYGPWIALAVIGIFFIVIAAYRQNVRAYPNGGGDYEVVLRNLGPGPGVVVASALLIDYVLTVAVAVSAAIANLGSVIPVFSEYRGIWAALAIGLLTLMNLRGAARGRLLVLPTYFFVASIGVLILTGIVRTALGQPMMAESATWDIVAQDSFTGFALAFLIARAFASGTTALTGIQVVANNVPSFQEPRARNAAATLGFLAVISMTMFAGITWLAIQTQVKITQSDSDLIGLPAGESQKTVIVQVAAAVFGNSWFLVGILATATVLILLLAANTAYQGFPLLSSSLGRDGFLPRQLHTRGNRLVFSNGILMLSGVSAAAVLLAQGSVSALIQLYIVGVFIAFSLSQLAMVRHWGRALQHVTQRAERRAIIRSRFINMVGCVSTSSVLVIVLVSKFTRGAWIVILAVPIISVVMLGIHRHYERVARDLAAAEAESAALPTRVHALVLVSRIHKPALRAVSYARATRPTVLEAVTVQIDEQETRRLVREWEARDIPVTLKVLDSPYRDVTRPILEYVAAIRSDNPNDLVIVYVPEYIVGHWWERFLHNTSSVRLRKRLQLMPGVMITSVPWRLESSKRHD